MIIMILPAGAFLTLGLLMGLANFYTDRKDRFAKEELKQKYIKPFKEESLKEVEA